jgi:hypothetical protein
MNGKIFFDNAKVLAEFLKGFTGSTAVFEVHPWGTTGYVLEFMGGF